MGSFGKIQSCSSTLIWQSVECTSNELIGLAAYGKLKRQVYAKKYQMYSSCSVAALRNWQVELLCHFLPILFFLSCMPLSNLCTLSANFFLWTCFDPIFDHKIGWAISIFLLFHVLIKLSSPALSIIASPSFSTCIFQPSWLGGHLTWLSTWFMS